MEDDIGVHVELLGDLSNLEDGQAARPSTVVGGHGGPEAGSHVLC